MNNIQHIRKSRSYSQKKLAAALGVSRSTVSMWETGASQPDNDSLIKLAQLLETSTDELLGIKEQTKWKAPPDHPDGAKIERIMQLLEGKPEAEQRKALSVLEALLKDTEETDQ